MNASRSTAQPHVRRPVNDGRVGNNDVQRAARAQRGGGGSLGRGGAAWIDDLSARPLSWYGLEGCALATTACQGGRLPAARLALASDADDCARPWRPSRAGRRQGPPGGYYARAGACVGRARATRRGKKRRGGRRTAARAGAVLGLLEVTWMMLGVPKLVAEAAQRVYDVEMDAVGG